MFPTLDTERLLLREIQRDDAESIFSYFSNDIVTQHYGMNTFVKLEQAENLIDAFSKNFADKRGIRWGIEDKDSKRLIGTIGFNLWSPAHKRAEVGYELHPDVWRMGYTSEALLKILEYGFEGLGLTRIGAVVYIENEASNQLLLKLGFEKEGTLRNFMYQNDKVYDVNIFAMIR